MYYHGDQRTGGGDSSTGVNRDDNRSTTDTQPMQTNAPTGGQAGWSGRGGGGDRRQGDWGGADSGARQDDDEEDWAKQAEELYPAEDEPTIPVQQPGIYGLFGFSLIEMFCVTFENGILFLTFNFNKSCIIFDLTFIIDDIFE